MTKSDESARLEASTGIVPTRAHPVPRTLVDQWSEMIWLELSRHDGSPEVADRIAEILEQTARNLRRLGVTKSPPGLFRRLTARIWLNHALRALTALGHFARASCSSVETCSGAAGRQQRSAGRQQRQRSRGQAASTRTGVPLVSDVLRCGRGRRGRREIEILEHFPEEVFCG